MAIRQAVLFSSGLMLYFPAVGVGRVGVVVGGGAVEEFVTGVEVVALVIGATVVVLGRSAAQEVTVGENKQ